MRFHEIRPFVRCAGMMTHEGPGEWLRAQDCRLFYVESGRGVLRTIGGRELVCREGAMMVLRPDCVFRIEAEKGGAISMLEVAFDYTWEYEDERCPLPLYPRRDQSLTDAHQAPEFEDMPALNIVRYADDMRAARPKLREVLQVYMRKRSLWRMEAGTLMAQALTILCDGRDEVVERVIELVEARYKDQLANGDIAAALGYHPNYANTIFRDKMGMTIHQYVIRYRIDMAIRLIMSTDMPISFVARETGFRYFSHFCQSFRRVTGRSPGDYRPHRADGA